ncbi:MAG: aldehyde ferredoxin oxidoreductase family protein [Halobacteriota archaeon]
MELPASVLRIDLDAHSVDAEAVPDGWTERFLGGKGLGARYLYELLDPGVDPLGPRNVLGLFRGPFSGYLPGETRFVAVTKSPLTGVFLDSYSGGTFADALVGALADHAGIIVAGRADEPVTVAIEDGTAAIDPAGHRWGLEVDELDETLDGAVAGIGPAGEHRVRYATIATDGGEHHAGRGGAGAVMGAKRLKAVVARGEPPERPDLEALRERYTSRYRSLPEGRAHRVSGTLETVDAADAAGVLPTRAWTTGTFEGSEAIGIEAVRERATDREADERGVPGDFDLDGDVPRGGLGIALGANLGIDDFDAVLELGARCDHLGIDLIEAGSALAWAMLASEAGLLDRPVALGDAAAARSLLEAIATRSTPLGDGLADGVDAAADAFGGADLVPTVKAMAASSYDPRPAPAMALAFATSDRGACHRRSRPVFAEVAAGDWSDADRVTAVVDEQDRRSLLWCYVVDDVTTPAFEDDLGLAYAEAAGLDVTVEDLRTTGERVWTLTRLFNVREGIDASDDTLPPVFERPLDGGATAGAAIDPEAFDRLRRRYYAVRDWGTNGRPTPQLVERVGLGTTVDELTPLSASSAGSPQS